MLPLPLLLQCSVVAVIKLPPPCARCCCCCCCSALAGCRCGCGGCSLRCCMCSSGGDRRQSQRARRAAAPRHCAIDSSSNRNAVLACVFELQRAAASACVVSCVARAVCIPRGFLGGVSKQVCNSVDKSPFSKSALNKILFNNTSFKKILFNNSSLKKI